MLNCENKISVENCSKNYVGKGDEQNERLLDQLQIIVNRFSGIEKVLLFGSRVQEDFGEFLVID